MDEENRIERYEPAARALEARRPTLPARFQTIEVEETPNLRAYARVLWKRRWTIAAVFFVLFTVVLIGTLKQTPIYRATAMLEIQQENPEILTLQDLFKLEGVSDTYLETQYRVLESDTLARRVAEELKLYQFEEFNPPPSWLDRLGASKDEKNAEPGSEALAPGAIPPALAVDEESYQQTLEAIVDRLEVEPAKRSRLVKVSFESEDPRLAAQVVNTLAARYIEWNLEARWEATQKATQWLSEQLTSLKGKLEKAEEELQTYARQNGLLFLESEGGNAENIMNQRLRQLQEELIKAQATRYEKEGLYRLVEAGDYSSLPLAVDDKLLQDLAVRLAELRREHAELSTTFSPEYPKVKRLENQIAELERSIEQGQDRIARRIKNDYLAAVKREQLLQQAFREQERQANLVAERSVQYGILKREVETNRQLYEGLLQRLKEAGVSAGLKASNIRVVDPADVPPDPARPRPLLNLSLAVVLGLGLGIGAAFLQEHLDNTLKSHDDIERHLRLPTLALIPSVEALDSRRLGRADSETEKPDALSSWREGKLSQPLLAPWPRIDAESNAHSALLEAFRGLRTSILLSSAAGPPRSLLLTGAQPAEGKTTVALNLAISLALSGQRVLLVDADMRRPCIHKALSLNGYGGLAHYLAGQGSWPELVQPTPVKGLEAIPCGPVPPNPAELLSSERMRALLEEARGQYSFVLLDSPPLLSVADSRILAALVEGVALICRGGVTPREFVQRAHAHVHEVGGIVIGVVLNNLDVRGDDYYYYRYSEPHERGDSGAV